MNVIALLLFSISSFAGFEPSLKFCGNVIKAKIERRYPVPDDVNYFMRGSPKTRQLGFATDAGNRILDLATGKLIEAPGRIDPVLSPDGRFLTVPMYKYYDPRTRTIQILDPFNPPPGGIRFRVRGDTVFEQEAVAGERLRSDLRPADLRRMGAFHGINAMDFYVKGANDKYVEFFSDSQIDATYQSVGLLRTGRDEGTYRVLIERSDGIGYRDYVFKFKDGGAKFVRASNYRSACGKNFTGALPVLNKSGTEFATYVPDQEVTKIYAIDATRGRCVEKDSIPAMVGKMDFSPNNKLLAFHVENGNFPDGAFKTPSRASQLGVFLFDRAKKRMVPVQDVDTEDSYYPVFIDDETLAFVSAGKVIKGEDRKFFVNLVKIGESPGLGCTGCDEKSVKGQFAALIGLFYNQKCDQLKGTFRQSLSTYSKMTPQQCMELVKSLGASDDPIQFPTLLGAAWDAKVFKDAKVKDLEKYCVSEVTAIGESQSGGVR